MIVEQGGGGGQASYRRAMASNVMSMKRVIRELSQEIDYLGALAELYRQGCNGEAQAAALEAKAALERLIRAISDSTNQSCPNFPAAA